MTYERKLYIADNQDITRAGLMYIAAIIDDVNIRCVEDKAGLVAALSEDSHAAVVMDYTLFDVNDVDDLLILSLRFPDAVFLIFSEELSIDFLRRLLSSGPRFGIVMKDSSLNEIHDALTAALAGRRYVCQHTAVMLVAPITQAEDKARLTKTETEILRCIASGMTTREIAEARFSSFHTINTHRKNIFRKLGVNNAHEATKYALRAGLVDSAEYYI